MTHTQTFIELAIEGGWKHIVTGGHFKGGVFEPTTYLEVERWFDKKPQMILLDPLAWQAVGKVKGWKEDVCELCGDEIPDDKGECDSCEVDLTEGPVSVMKESLFMQLWMVRMIASGSSIEEVLGEILK